MRLRGFEAGHVNPRPARRASRRRGLRAAVLIAVGMAGQSARPAAVACREVPFQETPADFIGQFLSRMEISGVRKFAKASEGPKAARYVADSPGFRLDLEYDEGRSLTAVEGLVRHPTAQDLSTFKEAAIYSFAYFAAMPETTVGAMVEARITALQQKKEPYTAYNGDIYLLLFATGDGALMFRIRRIECR